MSILFYSNQCKYSTELISIIEQNNISIKKININSLQEIPSFLEKVPTIIADGISQPLIGKKALEWVINQQYFNKVSNNINYTKDIKTPFVSELMVSNIEKRDNLCTIEDSTTLIFPTLKDFKENKRWN